MLYLQSLHFNDVITVFFLLLLFELYRVLLLLLNKVTDDLGDNDSAFALKTENKKIEVSFFFLNLDPFFYSLVFQLVLPVKCAIAVRTAKRLLPGVKDFVPHHVLRPSELLAANVAHVDLGRNALGLHFLLALLQV